MSSLHSINPKADLLRHRQALDANVVAGKGLADVLCSNIGPTGTLKMLVGGAGQLKLTKDGNVLLREMHIQHPVASLIARAATAQDIVTGDGSTGDVLVIGELLKLAQRLIDEGVHPRVLAAGLDMARLEATRFLDVFKVERKNIAGDRELMEAIARCSLATKLDATMANRMTTILVDAIQCLMGHSPTSIHDDLEEGKIPLDLFMVEVLSMKQGLSSETRFIKGMVMDHGCRHPNMPTSLKNCYVLTCNVSLEYEKTEVNSAFFYNSAEQRARLAEAERRFTDMKVQKIIELKRQVCTEENGKNFVVFNQKGIDPPSLDMFAREGIMALRRVKRRNMERLSLCCGGNAVNAVEGLEPQDLGFADHVWEISLGDEKYTFVEGVKDPRSCAILIKAPADHQIEQIKDAVRDGLRALRNAIVDEALCPGAGAFEIACCEHLKRFAEQQVEGKTKLGVMLVGESLLAIPRAIIKNSGFDTQDCLLKMQDEYRRLVANNLSQQQDPELAEAVEVGFDIKTGGTCVPSMKGIYDSVMVKRQMVVLVITLAVQLLLVDEIIKAGKQMGRG
eukprot:Gregarina_sp_Poly_1__1348@NODE_1333_length_4355_cov_224_001632_g897_i0_p1_GENE_NODE_1333_length_4355_cov_224_001632_g897_i0NODE_1333_length_4355_cov_224_001632_g897_i0_p1_ORF_typecomplete_len564_score102_39Cpn60_TCP1/PF00118_24/4_8e137_NODE_1333_length_4355_cov_224_001632_g897_i0821773